MHIRTWSNSKSIYPEVANEPVDRKVHRLVDYLKKLHRRHGVKVPDRCESHVLRLALQNGFDSPGLINTKNQPRGVADDEHGDGAEEDGCAGKVGFLLLILPLLPLAPVEPPRHLLGLLQLPPDDEVERGEDEDGEDGGEGGPGPGCVEQDVVWGQPQRSRPHVQTRMEAAVPLAHCKVEAKFHRLSFHKFCYIEQNCN